MGPVQARDGPGLLTRSRERHGGGGERRFKMCPTRGGGTLVQGMHEQCRLGGSLAVKQRAWADAVRHGWLVHPGLTRSWARRMTRPTTTRSRPS